MSHGTVRSSDFRYRCGREHYTILLQCSTFSIRHSNKLNLSDVSNHVRSCWHEFVIPVRSCWHEFILRVLNVLRSTKLGVSRNIAGSSAILDILGRNENRPFAGAQVRSRIRGTATCSAPLIPTAAIAPFQRIWVTCAFEVNSAFRDHCGIRCALCNPRSLERSEVTWTIRSHLSDRRSLVRFEEGLLCNPTSLAPS